MQLRAARLCLDCEEVHESQQCPICLSEACVFMTRWIPAEERRTRRLPSAVKVTPVPSNSARWVKRGVFGLAVFAASRWLWQAGGEGQSKAAKSSEDPDSMPS
jgi:hypothetical protein